MKVHFLIRNSLILFTLVSVAGCIFFLNAPKKIQLDENKLYQPEITAKTYANNERQASILVFNRNGDALISQSIKISGDGIEVQKKIAEEILHSIQNNKLIKFPKKITIKNIRIWNETLYIDFSKEISQVSYTNIETETNIIKSFVNSQLQNSKEFNDVQFLVEGERKKSTFGKINTINPFNQIQ